MYGLYCFLINNMIIGVNEGYKLDFEVVGVGYCVENKGQLLIFIVGYFYFIYFVIFDEVKVIIIIEKGKVFVVMFEFIDKQLVGQVVVKICVFCKFELYKGKGICFKGEEICCKVGKMVSK